MLEEIMRHLRNYFPVKGYTVKCTIENGKISLPFISDGQYFLIEGSAFNDGVYKAPVENMTDEVFEGFVTVLKPPKPFLDLVAEIEEFQSNYKTTPYQSESFGGYSYSRATGSNGNIAGWQEVFKTRLNTWRKI